MKILMEADTGAFLVQVKDLLNFDSEFDRQCIDRGLDYYPIVLAKLRIVGALREQSQQDAFWHAHFSAKLSIYLNIYQILRKDY